MRELESLLEQGMNVDEVRSLSWRLIPNEDDDAEEDDDDAEDEEEEEEDEEEEHKKTVCGIDDNKVCGKSKSKDNEEAEMNQNEEESKEMAFGNETPLTNSRAINELSDSHLGSILVLQLGMAGKDVWGLNRSERVKVIQFAAAEARRQGRDEHLWKYARRGSRSTSPSDGHGEDVEEEHSPQVACEELRNLRMDQLEMLLVQRCGAAVNEVSALSRGDRERVIQFAATEAKRMGYCEDLWEYASDMSDSGDKER